MTVERNLSYSTGKQRTGCFIFLTSVLSLAFQSVFRNLRSDFWKILRQEILQNSENKSLI